MLNINCSMTTYELLKSCHDSTVIPTVITLILTVAILMPIIIGAVFGFSRINWGKLALAEFLIILLLGLVGVFLILSPNILQTIGELFLK